ncbi:MAG TPA: PAS domain S-box protein [Pseudomonadales bacterium]
MGYPEQQSDARIDPLEAALLAGRTAVFALDLPQQRLFWSRGLGRMAGRREEWTPSVTELLEWLVVEDRPRLRAALARCARDGGSLDELCRVTEPSGAVRWMHWQGRTELDHANRPARLPGLCIDTTERQTTLMRLREGEARWRALVDASPLGIDVMDVEGRPLYYNPRCEELHGFPLDESGPEGWIAALHPDDRERIVASWHAHAKAVRRWSETYRFVHPDGRIVWVSGRTAPIFAEGRHIGHVGTLEDITSLKLAEQAARSSEAKLRRIIDSGMVGVFYWNADQTITGANAAFGRMLGYGADELESGRLTIRRITPWRWHPEDDLKVAEARAAGVTSPWEKEFYAVDGRIVPVLVVKATWADSDDSGIAICVDITPQKQAERERERLLLRERQAREEAERATRVRDEMVAVLAHDLRNPLNVIGLTLARLQHERAGQAAELTRDLKMLQRTTAGMGALIDDLLDVSRIESGLLDVRLAPVAVESLLHEVREQYGMQAAELGISLVTDAEPDLPAVRGEARRLDQVLANLVGNAFKFTERGGCVEVRVRREGREARFSVADSGCGIDPTELPHLFDRFWQGGRTRRAGAGLGLAIARGIVYAHGGRIGVESRPPGEADRAVTDDGFVTVFWFTIPLASA